MASRENYLVTSRDIDSIKRDLNFILARISDRLDKMEGVRGIAQIQSQLDMTDQIINTLGTPTSSSDAARFGDIPTQSLDPGDSPTFVDLTLTGDLYVGDDSSIIGDVAITGTLTVTGQTDFVNSEITTLNVTTDLTTVDLTVNGITLFDTLNVLNLVMFPS